ncbi:hypothetical protein QUF90_15115 [Desulfococcaceae bacterium HSG9]|nr:hypothetical protein [Desulfococcaceae bacterium HSG9]
MPKNGQNYATRLNGVIQLVVFSSTVYFFSLMQADPDLWGHIKFGEDLWAAGKLVRFDPYSFTAYNHPWNNHEWLAELFFYFAYFWQGDAGLLFGKLFVGLCIAVCLSKICHIRQYHPLVYAVGMILAIFVISPGFMIRPQIFSFLFFTFFLYILHIYYKLKKNYLFLLPFIMVMWVNLHGGFLMGWALLILAVSSETIIGWVSQRKNPQNKLLWMWTGVTSLAVCINPYGYKLLVFLFQSLTVNRDITEWRPIVWDDLSFLRFKIMACLFIITLCMNIKKSSGWEVCAILMILFASLRHQRHTPFFAIICAPYLIHHLSETFQSFQKIVKLPHLTKSVFNCLTIFIGLLAIYQFYSTVSLYAQTKCRIIVSPKEYPVSAVRFLNLNNIQGNIILPFTWGEYAIWKLYPDCRVSIDGRFRTVYDESVIQAHFIHPDDISRLQELINQYPADIFLARQSSFWNTFIKENKNWIYVYSDKVAVIFLHKKILKQFSSGLQYPKSEPLPYFP